MSRAQSPTMDGILRYIYTAHCVPRQAIRLLGYNYDWAGRVTKRLIDDGVIEEVILQNYRMLRLTDVGISFYESKQLNQTKESIPLSQKQFTSKLSSLSITSSKEKTMNQSKESQQLNQKQLQTGEKRKIERYVRNGWVEAILHRHFDADGKTFNFSSLNSDNAPCYYRMSDIKHDIYSDKVKSVMIKGSRAYGLIETQDRMIPIYNGMNRRLKLTALTEEKLKIYSERVFGKRFENLILITTDSVAKRLILEPTGKYFGDSRLFGGTCLLRRDESGTKQIVVHLLGIREKLCHKIFSELDIQRAKDTICDAIGETGTLHYIGVEENLEEISSIRMQMDVRIVDLCVYCFTWQCEFYRSVFGDISIRTLNYENTILL